MVTPLMSLSLPAASSTPGPQWASMLSAALATVDGHTHMPGSGARIPSGAINVNAALPFNGYDATTLRSLRMTSQSAALALGTDVGCLYVAGGDLYFNSSAGQQVKVTSGAGLNAGSIGGFSGDFGTSTAAATYTAASTTFSFTSAANKYASLDAGNVILREPGATSPFGVTLKSPTALAASYALTLPAALPASTKFLAVSSAGAVSASDMADGSTLQLAAGVLSVKDAGITTAKIAPLVWSAISSYGTNWAAALGGVTGAPDGSGIAHLRGGMVAAGSAALLIGTLPASVRPSAARYVVVPLGPNSAPLKIDTDGTMTITNALGGGAPAAPTVSYVAALDGITYAL